MKHLPLFYYSTTWILVDDDKILLASMAEAFKQYNCLLPFSDPRALITQLKQYKAPSSKYHFLHLNKSDEDYGLQQRVPLSVDISAIIDLKNDPERHQEITVMIIDYNMPHTNGFELAKQIDFLPIPKILLTGDQEESNTIRGFNDKLIERYVQKGKDNTLVKLKQYLHELTMDYFQKLTTSLLRYLEVEKSLPLSDPIFIDFFEQFFQKNDIREYYLIDKQGSLLCIDNNGHQLYFIVHTETSLNKWLEIYGEEKHLSLSDKGDVQSYKKIPFFGLNQEAGQVDPKTWEQHFYTAEVIEGIERYFWAAIKLETA